MAHKTIALATELRELLESLETVGYTADNWYTQCKQKWPLSIPHFSPERKFGEKSAFSPERTFFDCFDFRSFVSSDLFDF